MSPVAKLVRSYQDFGFKITAKLLLRYLARRIGVSRWGTRYLKRHYKEWIPAPNPIVQIIFELNSRHENVSSEDLARLMNSLVPIVHVVDTFSMGGLENFVLDLAASQKQMGINAVIVFTNGNGELAPEATKRGLAVHKITNQTSFQNFLVASRANYVFIHHAYSLINYEKMTDLNFVEVFHNPYWWQKGDLHLAKLREGFTAYVCVSSYVRNFVLQILKLNPERTIVIENAIPAITGLVRKKTEGRPHIFLNVGNFSEQKNQILLIRAFAQYRKQYFDFDAKLWIVGKGVSEAIKEAITNIVEPEVWSQIEFKQAKNSAEMHEIYGRADYFIQPSTYEGFSLASLEAMAHNLPIAISMTGGYLEFERDRLNVIRIPGITPDNESLDRQYIYETCWNPHSKQIRNTADAFFNLTQFRSTEFNIGQNRNYHSMVQQYNLIGKSNEFN
jgi:glycosyltransferase involved in cell wall biosynthesis